MTSRRNRRWLLALPATRAQTASLDRLLSLFDFEAAANDKVSSGAWERISGGAADELTLRWNHEAYEHIRLKPRALVDVSKLDTRVTLFGQELPFPILLAPTGGQKLIHPEGELAAARGAAAANATYVISSSASMRVEDIAKAATGPVWFQLYVQTRPRLYAGTDCSAPRMSGCRALCVTVGFADIRSAQSRGSGKGELPERELPNLKGKDYLDPTLTWKDVDWLRSFIRRPLLLKGILNPDDAATAVKAGVAGIIVSNHGARNLDTVPATIEALPVVERVGGPNAGAGGRRDPARDGCAEGAGVRGGGGADRPSLLWGLGVAGADGRCSGGGDPAQGIRDWR